MPSRTNAVNPSSRAARLVAAVLVLVALVIRATPARADNVTELVKQLENGSDYKVRLSAALSLAKLNDQRAVPAFITALDDSDKTVRGAAAVGLSKVVTAKTKESLRKQAIDALARVAKNDPTAFVQKQAQKALETLQAIGGGGSAPAAGAYYINIGPMAAKAPDADKLIKLMRSTAEKNVKKADATMATTWPGGADPTQKQLDAAKVKAYFVDGTITELTVKVSGGQSIVGCKVSMLVATYPKKSIFGMLDGGAKVSGSDDPKDIELAKGDCITAVVEDLVKKKIVPTIQSRTGTP